MKSNRETGDNTGEERMGTRRRKSKECEEIRKMNKRKAVQTREGKQTFHGAVTISKRVRTLQDCSPAHTRTCLSQYLG